MASNNAIILSGQPRGVFKEGTISGSAPKPGILVQVKAAVEPVGGRFTYELFDGAADGEQTTVLMLLADELQGKTVDQAYVDGDQIFMYVPHPGEEMQVLLENIAGTGDAFAIGDKLMVNKGTGKFVATTGSPESEPFIVLETLAALTADTLVRAEYTGY